MKRCHDTNGEKLSSLNNAEPEEEEDIGSKSVLKSKPNLKLKPKRFVVSHEKMPNN